MNKEKIAVLIDSGTDIPQNYLDKENVFVLPLRIIFNDKEYVDKVDINSKELFVKMREQIPTTSLPTGEDILNSLNIIRDKGFEKIIAITIAAPLSGTNTAVRNILDEYAKDLETVVLDTRSISIGSGMFAIEALNEIEKGTSFNDIVNILNSRIAKTKIYFTVGSLEYLKKGGRISSFAAILSSFLNIKPIISCDENGAYALVGKERGKKKSHDRLIKMAKEYIDKENKPYTLGLVYGEIIEDYENFKANALETFTEYNELFLVEVSPALGVHTGPDAMGISVQLVD